MKAKEVLNYLHVASSLLSVASATIPAYCSDVIGRGRGGSGVG